MWQMGGPGPDARPGSSLREVQQRQGARTRKSAISRKRTGSTAYSTSRLKDHEFVADAYSIADIAIWPWISRFEWQTIDLNAYPNVKRWYVAIANRPAVRRGYKVPKDVGEIPMP